MGSREATSEGARAGLGALVPEPFPVRTVRRETSDTLTLELDPAGREGGFVFAPGQFNMLWVFGVGECAISISGDPGEPEKLVHTVRAVGMVTRGICALSRGEAVGVRGPFGTPWPVADHEGEDVLIVAGGIGLAPLRPVVHHVLANRDRYGTFTLLYGARTPGDMLYRRDLERWRGRFDAEVDATVDNAGSDWMGHVGMVTSLVRKLSLSPEGTVAYLCGPEVMMRFTARELMERGLPDHRIWVSLERNMRCGIGHCGHCQLGGTLVCREGPVYRYDRAAPLMRIREL